MWAQELVGSSSTPSASPLPPAEPPHPSPSPPNIPTGAAAGSLTNWHGYSREDLISFLEQLQAQIEAYEVQLRRQLDASNRRHAAVQERFSDAQGDEPLEHGRPLAQQPPPQMVRPDVRLVLPDTQGMRVEHPSDEAWSRQAGRRGNAEVVTSHSAAADPAAEWSSERVLAFATMPHEEKMEVLLQALKQNQAALDEMEQKKTQAERMNHSLLTQLNAAKMVRQEKEDNEARLREEITLKDDQIKHLKLQLQQMQNHQNQQVMLRSGVKRGRFFMSKASSLECSNCRRVFSSEEDAGNIPCAYHPKAASEISSKMMGTVFPAEPSKLRYWSCCKKIGAKVPPPCCCGEHALRAV